MNPAPIVPTISGVCYLFQVLSVLFPFLCILSFGSRVPSRGFAWCGVAGIVLYEVIVFLLGTILGNIGFLQPLYYRSLFVASSVVLLVVAVRSIPAWFTAIKAIRYRPAWIDIVLAACLWNVAKLIDRSFVTDWSYGTASFDSLNYHIPRALIWSWQGSFAPTATNIWQQVGHPYGGAASVLPITLLGCGWLGGSYSTLIYSLGAVLSLFLICRSFGASSRASLMSGLFLLCCPVIGWRLIDTSTDMSAAFPVLAAVALIRSSLTLEYALFLFPALVGLGASIKQYVGFPAVPVAAVIFLPQLKQILTSRRNILAGLSGVVVAGVFGFLSFFPITGAFGNLLGDGFPKGLSTIGAGWRAAWDSVRLALVDWTLDVLRFLPVQARQGVFEGFEVAKLLDYLGFPGYNKPLAPPDKETCRAGLLSLILLPWLISAFNGWRTKLVALLGFVVVCLAQFSPLAINAVGARFAIIPLAAFCGLFAARASRTPLVTALLLLCVLFEGLRHVPGQGYLQAGRIEYNPSHEANRHIYPFIKDETLLLMGRPLSQDAKISGALGQIKFKYIRCPTDNNWELYLAALKAESRWLAFGNLEPIFTSGPPFRTVLGPECPRMALADFKAVLERAGWRSEFLGEGLEIWTHTESSQR